MTAGGVYLIEHPHGYTKIGRSEEPRVRLDDLQTACPYDLTLRGVIETDDAAMLEAELHDRYEKYQERGEWYKLPAKVKAHLGGLCDLDGTQTITRFGRSGDGRRRRVLTYQGLIG